MLHEVRQPTEKIINIKFHVTKIGLLFDHNLFKYERRFPSSKPIGQ